MSRSACTVDAMAHAISTVVMAQWLKYQGYRTTYPTPLKIHPMLECFTFIHSQCLNALHSYIASEYATLPGVLTLSTPMLECFTFQHSQCFCRLHSNIANVMDVLKVF